MEQDLPLDAEKQKEPCFRLKGEEIAFDIERVAREFPVSPSARESSCPTPGRFFMPLTPFCPRNDDAILRAAHETLLLISEVPTDYVGIRVIRGWVIVSGRVDWHWQREIVVNAMRSLVGAVGVRDNIEIRPEAQVEAATLLSLLPAIVPSPIEN